MKINFGYGLKNIGVNWNDHNNPQGLTLTFPKDFKPTKEDIKFAVKKVKQGFNEYAEERKVNFKPKSAIRHYSVYGWTASHIVVLLPESKTKEELDKMTFMSEPTGKYFQGRKIYPKF